MRTRTLALLALLFVSLPALAAVTGTVMTGDGQPIAGARVSLLAVESFDARRARLLSANPEAVPLASTQTDSKGAFSLESPKELLVDLRVTANGHEPVGRRIERDEEVGAIVMPKSETKSGTVRANGKPVANALVVVSYGLPEIVVKTDAEGRFSIPDPKAGRGIVVSHPDYAISEDMAMMTSGITNLNRTLAAGTTLTGRTVAADGKTPVAKATIYVDGWPLATSGDDGAFTASRAPANWSSIVAQAGTLIGTRTKSSGPLTIAMPQAATITGRAIDAKSKLPVAGVFVRTNTRMMRQSNDPWFSAISDAKGNFSILAVPGTYMLIAQHPGYELRPIDVSAAAGQSVSKELALSPYARVSGTVVDEERKPVAAASISSQEVREGMEFRMIRMAGDANAVSGPDGRFSLRVRSDTDLKLRATKKGMPSTMSDAFKLAPAERKSNVVMTIPSGIAVTGRVVDRDGNPLSGVTVASQPAPPGGGSRMMMQRIMIGLPGGSEEELVRTGSDGTFTTRVTEGTYDFTFRRQGFAAKAVRGKSVSVSGPNTIEATLDPSVEISGRVVRGGVGVEGVNVMSFAEGDMSDAITGPDGSFTLTNLTPGTVRLNLRKEDEMIGEMRTATAPGRDVVLELPLGGRVSGRVIDKSTRKPIASFQVGVSQSRSGGGMIMMAPPMMRTVTSDDGTFTLENVPVGAVNFMAQAPGYSATRLNLNVDEKKPITDLEVELDTGVKLVGKVTGPDGAALSDATVSLGMMAGSTTSVVRGTDKRTVTNSSGEYELDSLEAGEETIQVSHSKYLTERKTVQLKGREVRLDVQLSAGSRVSGQVVTESGAGVPEAEVEAMTSGGAMKRTRTDASGRFEFDSLSPARYQFSAAKSGYAESTLRDVDVSSGAPVRIVLRSGATLYGFVRGLTEQELATAMVEVRGSDGNASGAVDSSGAYRIEGAPVGSVRVSASVMPRNFTGRKSSPAQTVELESGGSRQIDIEFRGDTVIRGRVTRNGRALGGANVSFFPKPGGTQTSVSVTADEQGNYNASGLEDGEYSVVVSDMQRFASYTTAYEVRGSGTFDIEHNANNLRGRVVDAGSGEPVPDARVQIRNASSQVMIRDSRVVATDTAGVFNFDLIPPGNYVLTADKEGFGNHVLDLVVPDRPMENIELKLSRNDGVTLKVVDGRDGRALSANIVVFDMQGRMVHEQRSFFGGDGTNELKLSLAAGMYQATVFAMGYGTRHVSLRSPSTPTIAMAPAATLLVRSRHSTRERVRLVDASGVPYPRMGTRSPFAMLEPSPATTTINSIAGGTYTLQRLGDNDVVLDAKQVVIGDGQTVNVDM